MSHSGRGSCFCTAGLYSTGQSAINFHFACFEVTLKTRMISQVDVMKQHDHWDVIKTNVEIWVICMSLK